VKHISNPGSIAAKVDEIMAGSRARFGHGVFTMHGNAVLHRMEQERQGCVEFIDRTLAEVEQAGRDLSDTEKESLGKQRDRIKQLDEQIAPLKEFEELRGAHQETTSRYTPTAPAAGSEQRGAGNLGGGAQVTEREHKYRTAGEFLADAYKAQGQARNTTAAQRDASVARLRSHGLTVEGGSLVRAAAPHNTTEEVPGLLPVTIVGEIMSDVDAARPFISSIGPRDLGQIPGTSFERPTITQHVQVAKQTAEKATVANRQFEVDGVPFMKDTYGGWANVSRQSIDWTSPGVWDALMTDFIEQYGLETENAAADAFATAITQKQELTTALAGTPTLPEIVKALYAAAGKAYQGSGRLPDTIWASLDWWETLGVLIDTLKATSAGSGGGDSSVNRFAGNLLQTPRIVVPSLPAGTLIVGVKSRTEVYEDRFGFLSVVQPKVFGVELAYGGYMASGTIKPAAFCKIVNEA
jgi:hypothetical protein